MPAQSKKLLCLSLMLVALVSTGFAFIKSRINTGNGTTNLQTPTATDSASSSQSRTARPATRGRNLSLQPEAFNLSRRLGKRLSDSKPGQSVLVGTLTVGAEQRVVRITRKQTGDGEQVEIDLAGSSGPLTWDAGEGAKESGKQATDDRDLIERLVLDSPDQFVLAQLRGASYQTIARNLRPEDAGDGYTGPLWNVVRIGDSQRDEQKRPRSLWRLYYINARTGLIDKVLSEVDGERIEAALSKWTEVNGEKVAGEITWTRQGQTIMEFRLNNFSVAQQ